MASIIWSDVTSDYAVTVSATGQTDILARVNAYFNKTLLGGESSITLRMARIYLARHMATPVAIGAAGPLQSESEADLSRTYVAAAINPSDWSDTVWGQRLTQLLRATPARAGDLL
jgi:hypothetical protein